MSDDFPSLVRLREYAGDGTLLGWDVAEVLDELDLLRAIAAQLDEQVEAVNAELVARRPRVWLEGDTVPAGVWVDDGRDEVPFRFDEDTAIADFGDVLVEVFVSDHAAAVAAEREHRAGVPDA